MNALILTGDNSPAITSRDIAELVDSRHDDVKRSIDRLVNQGVIESPPTAEIPTATRPATVYVFSGERGKRDSIVVVAQLSPEFTARLVDRWQELEARAAAPALNPANLSRLQLIELAMQAEQERLVLEHVVAEQAPKVQGYDRIASAEGSLCIRDAAKALQVRPIDLKNQMIVRRWIYGRPGHSGWLAYQDKLQQGLLVHKVDTVARQDGTEKVVEQVRITPKGLTRLAEQLHTKAA